MQGPAAKEYKRKIKQHAVILKLVPSEGLGRIKNHYNVLDGHDTGHPIRHYQYRPQSFPLKQLQ